MRNALQSRTRTQSSMATAAKGPCSGLAGRCACDDCHRAVPRPMARGGHDFGNVQVERGGPPLDSRLPGDMMAPPQDEQNDLGDRLRRGSTLPYRQATELADCIRILGPDARDECRQLVLGEKPRPRPPCDIAAIQAPMAHISTFQSPGASGWFGAKFGCFRNNCSRRHRGWDLHAASGTAIVAAAAGRVTHGNDPTGYGAFIRLRTDANPNRTFVYAHLSVRHPAGSYCVGDTIGATGTSGNASADRPHLHFEVQENGTAVDPGALFTEPNNVIETTGTAAAVIDKTLPEPCNPCGM